MTTALYRRYRPDTFTEVIGQEHVTEPLLQALRTDRVTHAYLFSGPRGCGKTTSARILARCLNCAEGPTPEPCGVCDSCIELARGGPGSLDVVEIDAASHGGVDDARDLRERATFAPARDRFKIFILDEAHMVTSQGFNALLKIVEEPPPHVKFIFATTEPDKVIGTIRSRTHHYPFRLVGPATLQPYLEQLCAAEGVAVGAGVLPLVVRAGGGSVRDSLSVLDQLVAGADASGIDYERAVALLGYTHAALLDDVVDAIAARDGASAFRVVDRVVSSGHEPRRFVEDLLERLRDLIVIAASGEAAEAVLRDVPADQLERMRAQAGVLGGAELSRSADLVNAALSEMTGATSPRLHLELLVARLLLPAADDGVLGLGARLDRVERSLASGAAAPAVRAPAARPVPEQETAPARPVTAPESQRDADPEVARVPDAAPAPEVSPAADAAPAPEVSPAADAAPAPEAQPAADAVSARQTPPAVDAAPAADAEMVRRRWPEVLQTLRGLRMATWVLVSQNAQVGGVTPTTLTLAFTTPQLATTFRSGPHAENVQRALHETLGLDVRVETTLAEAAVAAPSTTQPQDPRSPGPSGPSGPARTRPTTVEAEASGSVAPAPAPSADRPRTGAPTPTGAPPRSAAPTAAQAPGHGGPGGTGPHPSSADLSDEPPPEPPYEPEDEPPPPWDLPPAGSSGSRGPAQPGAGGSRSQRPPEARTSSGSAAAPGRSAGRRPWEAAAGTTSQRSADPRAANDGADADPDDPDISGSGLVGAPLVAQMLGGTVIDEIPEG